VRCGTALAHPPGDPARSFAYATTALVLFGAALSLPLVSAAKFGLTHDGRLLSGVASLWRQDDGLLAGLVTACGLVSPAILLGTVGVLSLATLRPRARPKLRFLLRLAHHLEQWSMPDVQMLAIIVAFIKLSALVESKPDAGLWCYGAAAFFTLLAWRSFDPVQTAAALADDRASQGSLP
jgi:paraquat-inducible protein A